MFRIGIKMESSLTRKCGCLDDSYDFMDIVIILLRFINCLSTEVGTQGDSQQYQKTV